MQTTTLWTSAVFSTTTMSATTGSMSISSFIVFLPCASSRSLKAGSVQARATIFAPRAGERSSIRSIIARMSPALKTPFSISRLRVAAARCW